MGTNQYEPKIDSCRELPEKVRDLLFFLVLFDFWVFFPFLIVYYKVIIIVEFIKS